MQSANLACLPGPSVPLQFISYSQCCNPFFSWGFEGAGTALCSQWVRAVVTSRTPVCPTRASAGGEGFVWLCRSHWGGFVGFLGGVSVLLPPAQSQGFSLLMGPSRALLGMFLPAAIPELAFCMPSFSLESSRKQGGFGWCL